MPQIANFELHVTAIDVPHDNLRWDGGPIASKEAGDALYEAVDAFKAVLAEHGLTVMHSGYGVTAS